MQNVRCCPVSVPKAKILGTALRGVVPVLRMNLRCQANSVTRSTKTDTHYIRTILWHFLYNIVVLPIQYCGTSDTILRYFLYNIVVIRIQYCGNSYTILWYFLYNIVIIRIQYCGTSYTILWYFLYNSVVIRIQYCGTSYTILW